MARGGNSQTTSLYYTRAQNIVGRRRQEEWQVSFNGNHVRTYEAAEPDLTQFIEPCTSVRWGIIDINASPWTELRALIEPPILFAAVLEGLLPYSVANGDTIPISIVYSTGSRYNYDAYYFNGAIIPRNKMPPSKARTYVSYHGNTFVEDEITQHETGSFYIHEGTVPPGLNSIIRINVNGTDQNPNWKPIKICHTNRQGLVHFRYVNSI